MGFLPQRNQFDSSNPSGSPAGSSPLDGPPPHDAPRPAGADTSALKGRDPSAGGEGNVLGMSPRSRIIAALAMLMQSMNIIESTLPGAISPQMLMEVESLRTTLPDAVDQLTQQASPLGLLSSMGSALSAGGGMPGMMPGAPAGGPAGPPAGPGMGGGAPLMPGPKQAAGFPAR